MVFWSSGQLVDWILLFLIDVVDAHEGAGEGGYFAEGYEERFVDLALGVDEDAAIEHYEATDT